MAHVCVRLWQEEKRSGGAQRGMAAGPAQAGAVAAVVAGRAGTRPSGLGCAGAAGCEGTGAASGLSPPAGHPTGMGGIGVERRDGSSSHAIAALLGQRGCGCKGVWVRGSHKESEGTAGVLVSMLAREVPVFPSAQSMIKALIKDLCRAAVLTCD